MKPAVAIAGLFVAAVTIRTVELILDGQGTVVRDAAFFVAIAGAAFAAVWAFERI